MIVVKYADLKLEAKIRNCSTFSNSYRSFVQPRNRIRNCCHFHVLIATNGSKKRGPKNSTKTFAVHLKDHKSKLYHIVPVSYITGTRYYIFMSTYTKCTTRTNSKSVCSKTNVLSIGLLVYWPTRSFWLTFFRTLRGVLILESFSTSISSSTVVAKLIIISQFQTCIQEPSEHHGT